MLYKDIIKNQNKKQEGIMLTPGNFSKTLKKETFA